MHAGQVGVSSGSQLAMQKQSSVSTAFSAAGTLRRRSGITNQFLKGAPDLIAIENGRYQNAPRSSNGVYYAFPSENLPLQNACFEILRPVTLFYMFSDGSYFEYISGYSMCVCSRISYFFKGGAFSGCLI